MLNVIGSARNVTGLVVDGIDEPVPCVEVVLICTKPIYGVNGEGKMAKGNEMADLRFSGTPKSLRQIAAKLLSYADEAEAVFGAEPEPEGTPEDSGNMPTVVAEGPGPEAVSSQN